MRAITSGIDSTAPMSASGASTRRACRRTVPVEQEPRHTTRFLDADMRVLEVNIPAGDTSLEHMHRHDIATVCLECAVTLTRPAGGEWSGARTRAAASAQVTSAKVKPPAAAKSSSKPSVVVTAPATVRPGAASADRR